MARLQGDELLGAEEVAGLLGVKETTVWRWCREGTVPCLKVGKHWRVRREALDAFLRQSEDFQRPTLVGQLRPFLRVPDNVLAIAQNRDILHRLDAAFFRVGEARGGLLVKFYAGEDTPADELRAELEKNGLEIGRLEREERFLMRPEENPMDERRDELARFVEEMASEGRTVWASFNWTRNVGLDTAMEQQQRLADVVDDPRQLVVKTAALEDAIDGWSAVELRQAQSLHSGTILASEERLLLSRATAMPPL